MAAPSCLGNPLAVLPSQRYIRILQEGLYFYNKKSRDEQFWKGCLSLARQGKPAWAWFSHSFWGG